MSIAGLQGRCTCGAVRYRLTERPLFTHCCHCTWCQRETGSAFALNALIETACLQVEGRPEAVITPSASGKGQEILRCPACRVAVWSHYAGAGRTFAFVRVGTLETPAACPPDIHIFTSTRQPWLAPPDGNTARDPDGDPAGRVPQLPGYYDRRLYWPDWALARRQAALAAAG